MPQTLAEGRILCACCLLDFEGMTNDEGQLYGVRDASFKAAGGEDGIRRLVDAFFDRMGSDERFAPIHAMHPNDKEISRDKLARFLCGWLGGPKLYREKYGGISIPRAHEHLPITTTERDQDRKSVV